MRRAHLNESRGARTSRAPRKLSALYRGLEALYQRDTGLDPSSVLLPYASSSGTRELLLMRESDDGALEVALALDHRTLARLEAMPVDQALGDEGLANTLPVLEGLSHLMYVAEAARRERPISGLELETQAEVDKFAVCLLHRWADRRSNFDALFERLYVRFELEPMEESLRSRYETANRVAAGFARQLRDHVQQRRLSDLRASLRRFWSASMSEKRALSTR